MKKINFLATALMSLAKLGGAGLRVEKEEGKPARLRNKTESGQQRKIKNKLARKSRLLNRRR